MTLPIIIPCSSVEVAVGASAAALSSALDASQQPGRALYRVASSTAAWFAQGPAATTFTANAATDACSSVLPARHGMSTGDGPLQLTSTGTLPAGLALATNYWAIAPSSLGPSTFQLAASRANAIAGTAINITDAGTGVHTMQVVASAGVGSHFQPAALPFDLDGSCGAQVSVIQDVAAGKASVVRLTVPR